jgi:hypothetical protein
MGFPRIHDILSKRNAVDDAALVLDRHLETPGAGRDRSASELAEARDIAASRRLVRTAMKEGLPGDTLRRVDRGSEL